MNEYIVWDKDRKVWIDESYPFFINSSGLLCIQRKDKQMQIESDCEIFKPIGKTDINNKKIYADCSVVEFDYEGWECKAYFTYSVIELRYFLKIINYEEMGIDPIIPYFINSKPFKIIDTIQENKLGLIR